MNLCLYGNTWNTIFLGWRACGMFMGRRSETMLKMVLSDRWKEALLSWMGGDPKKGIKSARLMTGVSAPKSLFVTERGWKKFGK